MRSSPVLGFVIVLIAGCASHAPIDAVADAPPSAPHWTTYTIEPGDHDASLDDADYRNPLAGIVTDTGRDYELVFDPSAMYVLAHPTQPDDQLDWNKLPGLSDCNTLDLAQAGAMFGWRWRTELQVLEITAYANKDGVHQTPPGDAALFTLTATDLAARRPIHYRLWLDGDLYRFEANGTSTSLPRGCPDQTPDAGKWAAGFYFGGTSTAPSTITAAISERLFEP